MNELEEKYLKVFNNFLKEKSIENRTVQKQDKTIHQIISMSNNAEKGTSDYYVNFSFCKIFPKIIDSIYDDIAYIRFTNTPKKVFNEIIDAQHYNHQLLADIIHDLFEIGKSFGFYKTISPLKNIKINDAFDKSGDEWYVSVKTVAKLSLSTFLKEKGNSIKEFNKTIYYDLQFLIGDDAEIHPIVYLYVPYCNSYNLEIHINLHPSQSENQLKLFEDVKLEVNKQLETHLDGLLNRVLKIKKDDIETMTLKDKLMYITVLEMNKI